MEAVILCVGNELLNGKTVNSNAAEIGRLMGKVGIPVTRQLVLPDIQEKIVAAIQGSQEAVILVTGGLGPTSDDLTAEALAAAFGQPMRYDEPSAEHIREFFKKRGKVPTESNYKQAYVPKLFQAVDNVYGTAPFLTYFHSSSKQYLFAMPGVPREMRGLMNDHVLPTLQKAYSLKPILHHELLTIGLGESALYDQVKKFPIPKTVSLAFLPDVGSVTVRLSGTDQKELLKTARPFKKVLLPYLVSDKGQSLEEAIQEVMSGKKWTLSLAESCTGGLLAHRLTSLPGSSSYFEGAVVVYQNKWKTNLLGVSTNLLKKHGSVSTETVEAMLSGLKKKMKTNACIAITGIAGPSGGTSTKPVGLVWIGASLGKKKVIKNYQFSGSRKVVQERAATESLFLLWQLLKES